MENTAWKSLVDLEMSELLLEMKRRKAETIHGKESSIKHFPQIG
jgi:hypothetical protein